MRTTLILVAITIGLLSAGCKKYDNYNPPNAILSGKVVYNGKNLGVRTNGTQLELWQDGFQLRTKIPVYIAHDGSFSASLFDGKYKLVRLPGSPWMTQANDTLFIEVKGNTTQNIEVMPFFVINNESFKKAASNVEVKFTVEKPVNNANLKDVQLYFGKNILVDQNNNSAKSSIPLSSVTLGAEVTGTIPIPAALQSEEYLFLRIGVLSDQSNEYIYTQVQKLQLK